MSYYLTDNFVINADINTGLIKLGQVSKVTYTGTVDNDLRSNIYELKNRVFSFSLSYLF